MINPQLRWCFRNPSGIAGALLVLLAHSALAQSGTNAVGAPSDSIWTRPLLGGDCWGLRPELKTHGVAGWLELTQFGSGLVRGEGAKGWQWGGKLDGYLTLDGAQAGLWNGLYIKVHGEQNYGHDLEGAGGALVPNNIGLALPGLGDGDIGLEITQKFSDTMAVKFGKLNMVDAAKATPIRGGGGGDSFMNTALAVPITGLMPPEIFGAFLNVSAKPVTYTLGVYDPIDAGHRSIFDQPFGEGVSFFGSATLATTLCDLQGFYGVKAMYSTMHGFDLRSIPDLLLPPESGDVMSQEAHPYYFGVSFQQYFFQDAKNPQCGWGFFGDFGFSDGNPTPQQWAGSFGVGGMGLLPGRSADRWGLAVFRNALSSHLIQGLEPLFALRDEQGIEAFYNIAITPWLHITPDLQVVQPFQEDYPTAVFATLRANVRF